jgi:basic membrane protein A and related proteins
MKHSLILLFTGLALLAESAPAGDLTIGFIYVGPKDDYGYNQAHALGAASVSKLPGVKVVEEANVPETVAVEETMRDMIVDELAGGRCSWEHN